MNAIADEIFSLAQAIAKETQGFQDRLGPGKDHGNGASTKYRAALDAAVQSRWPQQVHLEEQAAPGMKYAFDYFILSEQTAVEIALSVQNNVTEFEKDVFKAILAKDAGKSITNLVIIGKLGSVKRWNGPGPRAIKAWVQKQCGIAIEVRELT